MSEAWVEAGAPDEGWLLVPINGRMWNDIAAASTGDGGHSHAFTVDPPKPAPVFDRAAFLKRQGLSAPTAIGPEDSAAIGNALRFGK